MRLPGLEPGPAANSVLGGGNDTLSPQARRGSFCPTMGNKCNINANTATLAGAQGGAIVAAEVQDTLAVTEAGRLAALLGPLPEKKKKKKKEKKKRKARGGIGARHVSTWCQTRVPLTSLD